MPGQRGKRGDPNYKHVSGQIKRELANKFKAHCAETERDMSDVLEELIAGWLAGQGRLSQAESDLEVATFLTELAHGKRPCDTVIVALAHRYNIEAALLVSLCDRLTPPSSQEHA